ncbi:MAG: type II secretion system protein GspH [Gammaproteobacteria bacterium]|nr:type II secretion system protein GspH [Gammaproteobacteria bacterium]
MNYSRTRAFTLIELLIVLSIIALIMLIAPPFMPKVIAGVNVKATTRDIASSLKIAQSLAINKQQEVAFLVNIESHNYSFANRKKHMKLPRQTKLSLVTARSEQLSESEGAIRFFPDGSSTGGQIKLNHINQEYLIDVHWLTGKVSIQP